MLESSSTISEEYAIKINQLIDKGPHSPDLSKLINHVTTGMNRILKERVVVQSNGKVKTVFNWQVMSGEYLVFKVYLGDERATLGIRVNKEQKNPFEFEQCFKKYNHIVSDEMRNLAIKFVDQLNKKPKLILVGL